MGIDWKDIGIRAGKTFIQTSLALLIGSGLISTIGETGALPDLEAVQKIAYSVGFGGLAAALSAVQNSLKAVWGSSE